MLVLISPSLNSATAFLGVVGLFFCWDADRCFSRNQKINVVYSQADFCIVTRYLVDVLDGGSRVTATAKYRLVL